MKKIKKIAFMAIIGLGIVFFNGCQKDNINSTLESNVALKKELITLNNELYSQINTPVKAQKISWQGIKDGLSNAAEAVGKACAVASADVISAAGTAVATQSLAVTAGVATGGTGYVVVTVSAATVGAVGGSYMAGKEVYSSLPPNSNPNVDGWDYLNSGNSHNQLLKELYEQANGNEFDNSVLVSLAIPKFDISATQASIFYSEEWNDIMEQVKEISLEYAHNEDNSIQLLNCYHERGLIDGNVYEILHSFMEIYSNIIDMDEISLVVSSYVDFVQTSTWLSSNERIILLSTLAVASKSPFFWIQFEDETNPVEDETDPADY